MRFLSFLLQKKRKEREEQTSIVRYILLGLGGFAALCLFGGVVAAFVIFQDLPDIGDLNRDLAVSTVILDRDGNELYKVFNDENRIYVPLERVSTHFLQAILSAEDRKFYSHPGVDILGIIRAQISNWSGNSTQGASTISQQVVKNLVTKDKTQSYIRKLREAVLAYQLEGKYSKDKILELYINQAPFGGNAYGVEMAANGFFNKSSKDLTLAESAVLAALPNGPTLFSPFGQNSHLLMGYCKDGTTGGKNVGDADVQNENGEEAPSEAVVTAREKVWLKITRDSDEEVMFEGTLEKGDQTAFATDESYTFATGNKNFDIYVGTSLAELPSERNFTFDPQDFTSKETLANTSQAPVTTSGDASVGCDSMDDPNYVTGRKDFILQGMFEEGNITKEERDQAWKESHQLTFNRPKENIVYPHFVMFVREYLEKKYGEDVGAKGYRVRTTIDPKLQDIAQEIVKRRGDSYAKSGVGNAALVSVDPNTGEILAMVGSRDYWDDEADGNVNVTVRKRQPGSSFKPFIFAQLFQGNWGPGSVMWDVKTRFGAQYPNNYEGAFKGPMTIRNALGGSRNIPPIKGYYLNDGEEPTLEFLAKMGFPYLKEYADQVNEGRADEEKFYYGYPIALGAGEVRPIDMATGYAIFANGGKYIEPTPILEITSADGEIIEKLEENRGEEVLDPQIAYEITDILSDVKARPGAFWQNALSTPGVVTAAKTGTSNKRFGNTIYPSDLWTVGYSRSISTAVWVGNNDGSRLQQGQDGLNFAAPIWKEFMTKAHDEREKGDFEQPDGIVKVTVSTLSGKRASKSTPAGYTTTDIFSSWAAPKEYDDSTVARRIDRRNGLLAGDGCATEVTETVYVYNVHSERPNFKDWEDPVQAWARAKGLGSDSGDSEVTELPKENSDCKPVSENDKLTIAITYPKDGGLVRSGTVNVDAAINDPFGGVTKVEYYVDGTLAVSKTSAPFNAATVEIPAAGARHAIKAVVYDRSGGSASSSVTVTTGTDEDRPAVTINAPTAGARVTQGASLSIDFIATDASSPVSRVDVYIDGKLLKTFEGGANSMSVLMDPAKYAAGSHAVKIFATDAVGNTASSQASFTIVGSGAGAGSSTGGNSNSSSGAGGNTNADTGTTSDEATPDDELVSSTTDEGAADNVLIPEVRNAAPSPRDQ